MVSEEKKLCDCGAELQRENYVLTSWPAQYPYTCPACGRRYVYRTDGTRYLWSTGCKKEEIDNTGTIEIPQGTVIHIPEGNREFVCPIPEGMEAEIKDGKVIIKRKESEDERIRKFLIELLSSGTWREEYPFSPIDCVAWLEKQKENPKSVNSISPNCSEGAKCEIPSDYPIGFPFDSEVMNVMFDSAHGFKNWKNSQDVKYCSDRLLALIWDLQKEQKPADSEKDWFPVEEEPVDLEKEIKKHTDLFHADIEYPLRLTAIKFYELGRKGGSK